MAGGLLPLPAIVSRIYPETATMTIYMHMIGTLERLDGLEVRTGVRCRRHAVKLLRSWSDDAERYRGAELSDRLRLLAIMADDDTRYFSDLFKAESREVVPSLREQLLAPMWPRC